MEEHLRRWTDLRPEAEDAIISVSEWADIVSVPALRGRLLRDALERQQSFVSEILEKLAEHGKTGEHWRPQ